MPVIIYLFPPASLSNNIILLNHHKSGEREREIVLWATLSLLSHTRNSAFMWRPTCRRPTICVHVEGSGGVHGSTVSSWDMTASDVLGLPLQSSEQRALVGFQWYVLLLPFDFEF